jgi:hypothetical protein
VIEFLVVGKESVRNIQKHLCNVYGSTAVTRSTADFLIQRVMASATGKSQLLDLPCSGHPVTAVSPEMLQRGDATICKD